MSVFEQAMRRAMAAAMGRRVVPSIPPDRAVELPPVDPPEEADTPPVQLESAAIALFIVYRDAAGHRSARRITVRSLTGRPPTHVMAWCHERRAIRNFRVDRIEEAADPETGEVYDLAVVWTRLEAAGVPQVSPDLRRAVNALVFLMRCDGLAHRAEWDAVDAAIASWCLRFGGTDTDCAAANRLARRVAPDADDLFIALRSFASSADRRAIARWLSQSAAAVIDADGTHDPQEFAWMLEVQEFLRTMARD